MLNISSILNNDIFTPEEQLEIIKYIDAQLEQMEILLRRLNLLAAQAAKNDTLDEERLRLQKKVAQIQNEIDCTAKRLPQTFIMEIGAENNSEEEF